MTTQTAANTETDGDFRLNMNFDQQVVINTNDMDWVASPSGKVWRKPWNAKRPNTGIPPAS